MQRAFHSFDQSYPFKSWFNQSTVACCPSVSSPVWYLVTRGSLRLLRLTTRWLPLCAALPVQYVFLRVNKTFGTVAGWIFSWLFITVFAGGLTVTSTRGRRVILTLRVWVGCWLWVILFRTCLWLTFLILFCPIPFAVFFRLNVCLLPVFWVFFRFCPCRHPSILWCPWFRLSSLRSELNR